MPYNKVSDLPDKVRNNLPDHAQKIYLEAFNHAWTEYKDPAKRATKESREETAHKVAWAAVKKSYVKVGDTWKPR
ncbi:MAG: ChaB family protein [Alphaproteobacteria bacterium]|nr:ChaB family protein [Alphaproteobacteria bacterium]